MQYSSQPKIQQYGNYGANKRQSDSSFEVGMRPPPEYQYFNNVPDARIQEQARAHSSMGLSHPQQAASDIYMGRPMGQIKNGHAYQNRPFGSNMSQYKKSSLTGEKFFSTKMGSKDNNKFEMMSYQAQVQQMFQQNPTMLIHQHNQCKVDNRERLKGVQNLDDLIHFKVKTVADHIEEDQDEQLQYWPQKSSISSQNRQSITVLKKICDPLLANRQYPKLLQNKKGNFRGQSLQPSHISQKLDIDKRYEIPEDLKVLNRGYSVLCNPLNKQSMPRITKQETMQSSLHGDIIAPQSDDGSEKKGLERIDTSDSFKLKRDKFEKEQYELSVTSANMKLKHRASIKTQEEKLQKQANEKHIDPVKMLRSYFNNKTNKKGSDDEEDDNSIVHGSQDISQKSVNPNYIIAKYKKMKNEGKLAKMDKQIEERSTHQHMMEQYNSYLQFQSLNDQLTAQNLEHLNKIQTQSAANYQNNPIAGSNNHFVHMRQELSNIFNQDMEDPTITNDPLHTETGQMKHITEDITTDYNQNIYLADGKTNSQLRKSLQMSNQNVIGQKLGTALVQSESGHSKIQNTYKSQEEIVESKLIGILNEVDSTLQQSDAPNPPRKPSQGLKFSELLKYQNVRNCGQNKSYVKYTEEQIAIAQKLKHLENKQQEETKKKFNKDGDASSRPLLDELRKKNKSMRKNVRNNDGKLGFNLNSSLPQIKNELERQTDQKVKEPNPTKKVFKEDAIIDNQVMEQFDDPRYSQTATPMQDTRQKLRQNPYVPISTNSRMKPRDNAETLGNGNRSHMDTYSTRKQSTKSGHNALQATDYSSYYARGNYMGDTFQISKIAPASRAQNSYRARTFTQDKMTTRRSDSVNNDLRTSKATDRVLQDADSNYDHFQQTGTEYPQVKVVDQRIWNKIDGQAKTIGLEPYNQDIHGLGDIVDIKTVHSPSTALIKVDKVPITTQSSVTKEKELQKNSLDMVTQESQIGADNKDQTQTAEKQLEGNSSRKKLLNIQSKTLEESKELMVQEQNTVDTNKIKDYNDPKSQPGSRGAGRSTVGRVSIYSSKQSGKVPQKPQPLPETDQRSSTQAVEESPQLAETNIQMRDNVLIEIQNEKQDEVAVGGAIVVDAPRVADPVINTQLENKTDTQRRSHELTSLNNSPQGTTSKYSKFLQKSAMKDSSPVQPFNLIDIAQSMNQHNYTDALDKNKKLGNRNISLINTQLNVDKQSSKASMKNVRRSASGERALSLPSQINIRQYVQQKLMEKTPIITDADERGYHSSTDPHMDNVSSEMFDQVLNDHLIRRGCWLPSRFKKFPRFTIFTQKDEMSDKRHLIDQYISLNPQVLALLAASDTYNIGQIASVLEEPAVTNRSTTFVNKLVGMGQNQDFMTTHNTMPYAQNSFEQDYSQLQLDQKKQTTEMLTETSPLKGPTEAKHVPTSPSQFNTQMDPAEMTQQQKLLEKTQNPFVQDQNAGDLVEIFHTNKDMMAATPDYLKYSFGAGFPMQRTMKVEPVQQSQIKQFDPFDRVLLTKGIDNQILTSFRTLNKSNNMISNTLKVVHQRFQPKSSKAVPSKGPKSKKLYQINEEDTETINERIFEQYRLTQQDKEDIIRLSLGVKTHQELNVNVIKKLDLMQKDGVWPNINVDDQTMRRDGPSGLNTGQRFAELGAELQRCSTSKTDTRLLPSRGDSIDKKAVKDGLVTVTTKAKGRQDALVNGTSYASSVAKKARMQQLPTVAMAQYDLGAGEELQTSATQPYLLDKSPKQVLNEKQQQQFNEIEAFSRENKINITAQEMNLPTFKSSPRQPSTMVIKADVSNVLKKMDAGASPSRQRNGDLQTSKTLTKDVVDVKTDNRRTEPTFGPQEVYEGTVSISKSLMPTPSKAQRVRTDRQAVKDYADPQKPATDLGDGSKMNSSPKRSDIDASENTNKEHSRVQTFYGSDATRMRANTKTARSKGEEFVIKKPDASVTVAPKRDQNSANVSQGYINVSMGPSGARMSLDEIESWGRNATQSKGSLLENNPYAASMKKGLTSNGEQKDSKQNTGIATTKTHNFGVDQRESLADSMQITRKSLIKLEDGAVVKDSSGKTSQIMNQDILPMYNIPKPKKDGGKFGAGGFRGPKVKPETHKKVLQKPAPKKRASIERNSEAAQAATQSKEELMELVRRNNTGSEVDNLILTLANDTHRSGASPISTTKAALVGGGIMTPEDRSLAQFSKDQSKMDSGRNKNTTEDMVQLIYARNFQNDYPVKLRRIIDEIYQKEQKMKKKVMDRRDMRFTNDFLFDLAKVRPMEGLTNTVESEQYNPYPVHVQPSQLIQRVQENQYKRPPQKTADKAARVLQNLDKERKKIEEYESRAGTQNTLDPFTNREISESQNTQTPFYVLNTRNPPLVGGGKAEFVSSKFNNNSHGSSNRDYKFMSQQRDRDRTTRNPVSGTRGVSVGSQGEYGGHKSVHQSTPERRQENIMAQTVQHSKMNASEVKTAQNIDSTAPEIVDIGQDFIQGLSIQIKNESLTNNISIGVGKEEE